jgi:hypothetical protein
VGLAVGLTAGAALVNYGISRDDVALMGAISGLGVGAGTRCCFYDTKSRVRCGGAVANPPAWALGWFVTSCVITRNIDERFTNFGASGALVSAVLTWLLFAVLFRGTEPEARR